MSTPGMRSPEEQDRDDRYAEAFEARVAEYAEELLADPARIEWIYNALPDYDLFDALMARLMAAPADSLLNIRNELRALFMPAAIRVATEEVKLERDHA